MSLDDLLSADEGEPVRGSRGGPAVRAFALAVVAAAVLVVLAALLLYGAGTVAAALWNTWWRDFA